MADERVVGRARLKRRNPWGAWLLAIVTAGIYYLVWYYKVNRELRDYGEGRIRVDPVMALLAVTVGAIIIVPPYVSAFRMAERVKEAQQLTSARKTISGGLALLLFLVGFYIPYVQSHLNAAWDVEFERQPVAPTPQP